ncbi:MAG TPA: hypothetical protein VFG42_14655 [Baekduia sp.]|uniref:SH3 domain-containing protein n=1 Tax=Baekduia sp. TaxID=2600305 RepID=UPI002D788444|nr:hypothetical protein [Baekduia sp.]HET6508028.1 hypothetical protein [Baekduia sp.]
MITSRRLRAAAALPCVAAAVAAGAGTDTAQAAQGRAVCVSRATLYETPNGIPVGEVTRDDRVIPLRWASGRVWVRVRTTFGPRGWMRARHLC